MMPFSFARPYWNLLQALAWIYLADRDFVEQAGEPASDELRAKMMPMPDGGEDLIDIPAYRVNVFTLTRAGEARPTRYHSFAATRDALLEALTAGRVTAIGLENNRGDPKPVPAIFWLDATFSFGPETAGTRKLHRAGSSRWFDLHFPREQVLGEWPSFAASPVVDRPATAPSLSFLVLARRWLAEQPGTGPTPEEIAVDMVRAAEDGAFTSKSKPTDLAPKPPACDARFDRVIHTHDQHGVPQGPHWIRNYVNAGSTGSEYDRRLKAARDLSVDLPAVGAWLATDDGAEWAQLRGLVTPSLLFGEGRPPRTGGDPVVSLASDETKCRQWLLGLMKQGAPKKAKDRYREQALGEWRISIAGFKRAWAWAIEESGNAAWKTPGRKSTRGNRIGN